MKMIEVDALRVAYGAFRAVDGISFSVDTGEVVGFLGPNGAGKSTTLRVLSGFLAATSGAVHIAGVNVAEAPETARSKLGYMPEMSPLYPEMRVEEYLRFRAELKKVPRASRKQAVLRAMEEARVDDFSDVMIGHLSKGYKQRVGLADALVASPPLLILDEPTAGLDPNQIREVRALIRNLGKERTVLLSTHILSEVEATCSRAVVITRGRLVAEGSIEEVRAMRRPAGLEFVVRGDKAKTLQILRETPHFKAFTTQESTADVVRLLVSLSPLASAETFAEEAIAGLVRAGQSVREVVVRKASLEDVFAELTERSAPSETLETTEDDGEGATSEHGDGPSESPKDERHKSPKASGRGEDEEKA